MPRGGRFSVILSPQRRNSPIWKFTLFRIQGRLTSSHYSRPHDVFQSHSQSANVFEDVDTIRVSFVPALGDHGKFLSCRAENPHLPSNNAVEDQWKIDVQCT